MKKSLNPDKRKKEHYLAHSFGAKKKLGFQEKKRKKKAREGKTQGLFVGGKRKGRGGSRGKNRLSSKGGRGRESTGLKIFFRNES